MASKKGPRKAYVPPPQRILTSPESVKNIRSIVCLGLADDMLDKETIKQHFSQFGRITRTTVTPAKGAATIHFADHKSAAAAKQNGNKGLPEDVKIFFSQNVGRRSSTSGTSTAARRVSRVPTVTNLSADTSEVEEELRSMQDQGDYIVPRRDDPQPSRTDRFLRPTEKKPATRAQSLMAPRPIIAKALKSIDKGSTALKPLSSITTVPKISNIFAAPSTSTARPVVASSIIRPATSSSPSKTLFASTFKPLPPKPVPPKPVFSSSEAGPLLDILKRPAMTVTDRIAALEARDKLLRLGRARQFDLASATRTEGTCPDMCPEKERYLRDDRHQVAVYEQNQDGTGMNHLLAVKQYSRSSADQELPLAYELRPPHVLRITMNHLLAHVASRVDVPGESLGDWYFYLWDRTRAIRKDITQQELCDADAVTLVEQCARFHITCSARLAEEGMAVFDTKINTENLAKCLQTLKHLYHDMSLKGITCPNEPEFRAYVALLNLNTGDAMWEVQQLEPEVRASPPVQFAVQTYLSLSHHNYVRFFKLVRAGGYLNAAILMRYFTQARSRAIEILTRALCPSGKAAVQYPLPELVRQLGFEDTQQASRFCDLHGLDASVENGSVLLSRTCFMHPEGSVPVKRARNLVESQLMVSLAEVIAGCSMDQINAQPPQPSSSFDPTTGLLSAKARELFEPILSQQQATEPAPIPVVSFIQPAKSVDHFALQALATNAAEKVTNAVLPEIINDVAVSVMKEWKIAVMAKKAANMCMISVFERVIRGVCAEQLNNARLEEKARQQALEMMRLRAEKQRAMLENLSLEMSTKVLTSVLHSEIDDILVEEIHRQQVLSTLAAKTCHSSSSQVVVQMIREVAREEIQVARAKWAAEIAALTERLRMKRAHRMLLRWREIALRARRLWQRVQDFPASRSSLDPAHQANELSVHVREKDFKYPVPGKLIFKPDVRDASTQSLPLLDMSGIQVHLPRTHKSVPSFLHSAEPVCAPPTWQIAVSVPANQPILRAWTERCFAQNPLSNQGGICVYETRGVILRFNIRVGFHSIKSAHGIVLVCNKDMQIEAASRLGSLLYKQEQKCNLPVAILMCGESGDLEEVMTSALQDLGERGVLHHVRTFSIPNKPNSTYKLEEAIHWLAGRSSPLDCLISCPLSAIISSLQRTSMWASLVVSALPPSNTTAALEELSKQPDACLTLVNAQLEKLSEIIETWKPELHHKEEEYITQFCCVLPPHWNTAKLRRHASQVVRNLRVPLLCPGADWNHLITALDSFTRTIVNKPRDATTLLAWASQQILASSGDGSTVPDALPWPCLIESILQERLAMCDFSDPYTGSPLIISLPRSQLEQLLSAQWCAKEVNAMIGVVVSPLRKMSRLESVRHAKKREVEEVGDKIESLLLGVRQAKAKFARLEAALRE